MKEELLKKLVKAIKKAKRKRKNKKNQKKKVVDGIQNNKPNFGHQNQIGGGGGGMGGFANNPLAQQRSAPAVTTVLNTPATGGQNGGQNIPNPLSTAGLAKEEKLLQIENKMNEKITDLDKNNKQLLTNNQQLTTKLNSMAVHSVHGLQRLDKIQQWVTGADQYLFSYNPLTEPPIKNIRQPTKTVDRLDGAGIFSQLQPQQQQQQQQLNELPPIEEQNTIENVSIPQQQIIRDPDSDDETLIDADESKQQEQIIYNLPPVSPLRANPLTQESSSPPIIDVSNLPPISPLRANPLTQESVSQLNEPTNINTPLIMKQDSTDEKEIDDQTVWEEIEKRNAKEKASKEAEKEEKARKEAIKEQKKVEDQKKRAFTYAKYYHENGKRPHGGSGPFGWEEVYQQLKEEEEKADEPYDEPDEPDEPEQKKSIGSRIIKALSPTKKKIVKVTKKK